MWGCVFMYFGASQPVNAARQPTAKVSFLTQAPVCDDIDQATPAQLDALKQYIKQSWLTLRRSNRGLLAAARDPKHPTPDGKWPVYISPHENIKLVHDALLNVLPLADLEQRDIKTLGRFAPKPHGILYLPHPYVVPGGRLNEL